MDGAATFRDSVRFHYERCRLKYQDRTPRPRTPDRRDGTIDLWLPSWDASYAANTGHHRAFDAFFLETTPLLSATGCSTSAAAPATSPGSSPTSCPTARWSASIPSRRLLAEARACAGPNQSFVEAPVQHLAEVVPADPPVRHGDEPGRHAVGADGRPPRLPGRVVRPAARRAAGSAWRWAAPATSRSSCRWSSRSRWPTTVRPRRGRSPTPAPTSSCSRRPASHRPGGRRLRAHRGPAPAFDRDSLLRLAAQPVLPGLRDHHAGRATTPPSRPRSRAASTSCAATTARFDQTYVRLDALARTPGLRRRPDPRP